MRGRISAFGVIAGVLILFACIALLQGATRPTQLPAQMVNGETTPFGQSPNSYVYTLMAAGAIIVLASFIGKPALRAVLFIAAGLTVIILADNVLHLYRLRDIKEPVFLPYSLKFLGHFEGWAKTFGMPRTLDAFFASMFAGVFCGSLAATVLFLGAIHACARAKANHAARIVGGVTALITFITMAVSTLYLIIVHPAVLQNTGGVSISPLRDQIFSTYALVFCLAGLAVVIFPIYPIFFPNRAKRTAQTAFWLLVAMGISLPAVLIGMIFWTSRVADTYIAGNWAAISILTAIEFTLLLLPLVLMANGVSLILRHFAGESTSQAAPPLVESA